MKTNPLESKDNPSSHFLVSTSRYVHTMHTHALHNSFENAGAGENAFK